MPSPTPQPPRGRPGPCVRSISSSIRQCLNSLASLSLLGPPPFRSSSLQNNNAFNSPSLHHSTACTASQSASDQGFSKARIINLSRVTFSTAAIGTAHPDYGYLRPPVHINRHFPSPFHWTNKYPTTLVELRIRWFSAKIREKQKRWDKVFDNAIVTKWREEIIEHDEAMVERFWGGDELYITNWNKQWPREELTNRQLNYVFDQLRYLAQSHRHSETGIQGTAVPAVPAVCQSSNLIPSELKEQLRSAVGALENVPPQQLDWHPGSNGQVLDLVHPSLYCYRIGHSISHRTPSVSDEYHVLTKDQYRSQYTDLDPLVRRMLSEQHQWPPTDFDVSPTGSVQPVSYIHNVHPTTHRALYAPICAVLERFIPLFEAVLTDVLHEPPPLINPDPLAWYKHAEDMRPDADAEDFDAELREYEELYRWPDIPEPPPFAPPTPVPEDKRVRLRGARLQVVVKLANIVLTPENPRYAGGTWHVEGMANERIVATGIYYYASENISESRLAFRTALGDSDSWTDWKYEQDDRRGFGFAYGLYHEMNQELGAVLAAEDGCVAFPNVYQHCVRPFELEDKTRPGARKILCFFLVDPDKPVLGTGTVPPQQREWYLNELAKVPRLRGLPQELWDWIVELALEGTTTREEAEEERRKLMEERGRWAHQLNKDVFQHNFNMCEH